MQDTLFERLEGARSMTQELGGYRHEEPIAKAIEGVHEVLSLFDESALAKNERLSEIVGLLDAAVLKLADVADQIVPDVREKGYALLHATRNLKDQLARRLPSQELPSKPLLGVLPLARVVPQDVHAVMDYLGGATVLSSAMIADTTEAKAAGAVLGGVVLGLSLTTDYRLSAAKIVPIEAHEVGDYVFGIGCIAAPFALGYFKKDPLVSILQIATGASTILSSLFTDYRAATGVGRTKKAA